VVVNRISDSLDEDEYHWKKPWGVKRFESMILAKFMLDHAFNGLSEDKLKDDEKIAFENLSNSAFSKMFNDEFSEVGLNYEDMQEEIQKKIDAKPAGFFTQVIHSKNQIEKISDEINNFKIIPCLLLPSENNLKSAEFLKIDWSNYKEDILGFINKIHSITDDILITSPNDFKRAYETISKLAS